MLPSSVDWNPCPPEPMAWIRLREPILHLITTPALLLPLLACLVLLLSATVGLGWAWRALLSGLAVALLSLLYSPLSTAVLSAWLTSQLPEIAAATTTLALRETAATFLYALQGRM